MRMDTPVGYPRTKEDESAEANVTGAAPLDLWDEAPAFRHPEPDLAFALRTLGDSERLAVLNLLASGEQEPAKLAKALGLPLPAVRSHLIALAEVGLAQRENEARPDTYQLANHAISLLRTTLSHDTLPVARPRAEQGRARTPSIPPAPLACTVCDNRGFVSRVLGDLGDAVGEAREYHGRIQEMSSQVLTAHEAERKRIARELHDDTAQALTSILVRLRLLERTAHDADVLKNVEELRELTAGALDSVRRMAMDLRPAALDDLGLVPALQTYAERFSENWPIKVTVTSDGLRRRLPADVELVLYRVVQEALTNVAKHSAASLANVSLKRRHNAVVLRIEDDGVGFDVSSRTAADSSRLGLFGIRERLALVDGDVQIESDPGKGTAITARVPLAGKDRPRRVI
jgi:signal transduction histidine kinase